MAEFLDMGGYGAFVWPSYLLGAVVLAGVWIASRRTLARREAELERLEEAGLVGRRRARGGRGP